ncbi:MAG: type II secretion system F family protein [Acidobacteriota bacterium]
MLIGVFLALTLVIVLVVAFASKGSASQKTVQNRLSSIGNKLTSEGSEEQIQLAQRNKVSFTDRISARIESYHFAEGLEQLLIHAGSKASVGSIVLSALGFGIVAGGMANWFGAPLILSAVATCVGLAIPYYALKFQRNSRLKKFENALPDSIELMARALRAGHSMASSIEIISEQSPEPLSSEFSTCFQQQKFGIPFRDALTAMGERVPSNDLHFLITAVLVQKETGGDLTDILDRTTHVIRERVRIHGEIRTYTAQGRLTGWILSLMPVAMLGLINIMTPGYSHILFYDPTGQKLLGIGVVMISIGAYIISRIVDIKV